MTRQWNDSLRGRWRERLEREPDGRALAFVDRRGRYEWRSFGELYRNAAGYGATLAEHGLGQGDVCVLMAHSDEHSTTALLGAFLVGAVPVLLAPPMVRGMHSDQHAVLRHVVRKTRARMVIFGGEREELDELARANPRSRFLLVESELPSADPDALHPPLPSPSDIAAYQLTSGTTGFPRVCVWEQRGVLAALDGMKAAMGLGTDDLCVNWTPLYHDMGLVNNFLLCLTCDVPLVFLRTMDFISRPALWLRVLSDTGATVTWSPNFGFALAVQRVQDRQLEGCRLDRVRSFWNAAERVHFETMEAFHSRFAPYGVRRAALKTNFGCAENVGGATFSDPGGDCLVEHLDPRCLHEQHRAVPAEDEGPSLAVVGVGRPCPGMAVRILSRTGKELPDGHVGEIALDTPSRMRGYLGNARETRRALRGGLLRSGDLGYLRSGELFWVGRARERINLRGKKLDPSDFERLLLTVAGLREGCFAVFGVDDVARGTQRLVIVSEVRDSTPRPFEEILREIREQVARSLGVSPDEILLLPRGTMTKTTSGKRRHRFYRQLYLDGALRPVARS